ncbi:DNA gyrase subunit B [Candidatus Karelsulcia muelleri]|nr:DNA gyrase subunit B [Candidatus Karelsulcia muelleri]
MENYTSKNIQYLVIPGYIGLNGLHQLLTVLDNGRGMKGIMTKVGAGGKFDKKASKISGGFHGVGIYCVNALSCYLLARIFLNGKEQIYSKGIPITKLKKLDQQNKKKMRGTEITFKKMVEKEEISFEKEEIRNLFSVLGIFLRKKEKFLKIKKKIKDGRIQF